MRLQIIVPAYNVAAFLSACLTSLTRCASPDYAVLVVDDGSPDESGAIADRFAQSCPRVRVLHQANAGVSAARNAGMALTEADWVWFVDGDDLCAANAVETLLAALDDDEDELCFRYLPVKGEEAEQTTLLPARIGPRRRFTAEQRQELLRQNLYDRSDSPLSAVPVKNASFAVYRLAFLRENGLTFETLPQGQDSHFNFRTLALARQVGDLDAPLYLYRRNPGSISVRFAAHNTQYRRDLHRAYARAIARYAPEVPGLAERLRCRALNSARLCLCLQFSHADAPRSYAVRRQQFRDYLHDCRGDFATPCQMGGSLPQRLLYQMIRWGWFAPLNAMYRLYTRKWRKRK